MYARNWTFENARLDAAQASAREVFPTAVFIVYFSGPFPYRPKRRRRRLTR